MDQMEFASPWDGSSQVPAPGPAEADRPRAFRLGEPRLSSAGTAWPGFPLEVQHASGSGFFVQPAGTYSLVALCMSGRARIRVEADGVENRFILEEAQVCVFAAGRDIESYSCDGSYEMLVVELRPCPLRHPLANGNYLARLPLASQYGVLDNQLASLLCSMRSEVAAGCVSGSLYGESLSLALVTYLANRYPPDRPDAAPRTVKLSAAQFTLVRDYVRAHLSDELGLAELAAVVHLSPHHFCFLFKNTAGISPYQYVLRERIHASVKHLQAGRCSIVEVAGALGFANQSHFTAVFRKVAGMTPKQYQRCFPDRHGHDSQRSSLVP